MKTTTPAPRHDVQQARLAIRIGKRARLTADVAVTDRGLLAVGALVSAILLSTAVVVHVARTGVRSIRNE